MKDFRRWLQSRRIAVLMGGASAERPVSLRTGKAVLLSLRRQGLKAVGIDASGRLPADLKRNHIDLAYLALHGPGGEDGTIQGLLEWLQIPFTGSSVLASALAMDKIASKRLFQSAGLKTAPWASLTREEARTHGPEAARKVGFPLVVKPARQGSAFGVSIVKSIREFPAALRKAFRYDSSVVVEKFLRGPEITIGVLGSQPLPIIEIIPSSRTFYDYQAKYAPGGSRHILPARLSGALAQRAQALALAACRVLQTRAVARVDLIVDRGRDPTLLEVNTIPGMTETSLLPEAAGAAGIDFDRLVFKIMEYSFAAS